MASGHVRTAPKGRTHGRTDQYCEREESPCQLGAVHTWHYSDESQCSDSPLLVEADIGVFPSWSQFGRVGMWRGGCRLNISVTASFVWRCLSGSTLTPFPHSAHRTGQADLPHPALGQNFTPSPTTGRAQAGTGVRARSARKGARVDKFRPYFA